MEACAGGMRDRRTGSSVDAVFIHCRMVNLPECDPEPKGSLQESLLQWVEAVAAYREERKFTGVETILSGVNDLLSYRKSLHLAIVTEEREY